VAVDPKKDDPKVGPAPKKEPGELVMYCPGPQDPTKTKWRGVEFLANVPVRVFDAGHLEAARGNKNFSVGNKGPDDDAVGPPTTAMEYRGHVVDWLKNVETVDQFVVKWSADRELRKSCEVGHDDLSYLGTIVEPKLRAMRLAESMSENDVAGAFVKRGVLEIPWRS
jgi:hypothetical protein